MTYELNAKIRDIPIPPRIQKLPISELGFPIPWFVAWVDGKPDFRVVYDDKALIASRRRVCWICGEYLGSHLAFTVGPMCVVNRTSAEPPEHRSCAEYAVKACPFLNNPRMRRNEAGMPEERKEPGGVMIRRNPGATAIYMTRSFKIMKVDNGYIFRMGDPDEVLWFAEGRTATRAEVDASIKSGLPLLEAEARKGGLRGFNALQQCIVQAQKLLPVA